MAESDWCSGTVHSTENDELKATTERQRLRIDHQTIVIRVSKRLSSFRPAQVVFDWPA